CSALPHPLLLPHPPSIHHRDLHSFPTRRSSDLEETSSFQTDDVVHTALAIGSTQSEHGFSERLTAVEKRGDVLEEDSGAGEVRDLANVLAEQLGTVHVFDVCGSVDHVR